MPTLGILELENEPMMHPGALSAPGTFSVPVLRAKVPGATVASIVGGNTSTKQAYIAAARGLEQQGATAIIANCGFTAIFQADVAAAVSVPVAMSSLMLVPLTARLVSPSKSVGLLTYDSRHLGEAHFRAAGWSAASVNVTVGGIELSESWNELAKPSPRLARETLVDDVVAASLALLRDHPETAILVFECAGFPLASEAVRKATKLPVMDCVDMANLVLGLRA